MSATDIIIRDGLQAINPHRAGTQAHDRFERIRVTVHRRELARIEMEAARGRVAEAIEAIAIPAEFQTWGQIRTRAWLIATEHLRRVGIKKTATAAEILAAIDMAKSVPSMTIDACAHIVAGE